MSGPYLIFTTVMTLALLLMVAAYIRTLLFIRRQKLLADASFNPLEGVRLWRRIFTPNGYGEAAEASRRGVARLYWLALAAFVIAVVLFFVLPAVPG
ncbi:hypothetical protein [Stappia sp.]|uniref:hypothetical protein n=1 Tax=Stappia sp. TaxID=1870903 RepID=UPI003C7B1135